MSNITLNENAMLYLKADYYRPEMPTFNACYFRLSKIAQEQGWGTLPNLAQTKALFKAAVPEIIWTREVFKRANTQKKHAHKATPYLEQVM